MAAPKRPTAQPAALTAGPQLGAVARILPSGRSILIGLVIAVLGVLAYVGARETSVFAVKTLEVRGGTAATRAHVRAALESELGRSLLLVDRDTIAGKLSALPDVLEFTYDRNFPNTLRVTVRREQPVLVLRQGADAYLVAATGRVLKALPHPMLSHLPRLWVKKDVPVSIGEALPPTETASVRALAVAERAGLPGGVRSIVQSQGSFALELGRGLELRLGQPGDVRLKLAIAKRILRATGSAVDAGYLDVSVPERPVLSVESLP
ncbi:MAG TPA: FtsQ-type POTRA domain-containing protein [Gaiellaceae bacterium]|nr:FtsQ-type POTRA domain-containing protein [Gaiellaceae bacterium]